MASAKGYKDLIGWQKAIVLVNQVYDATSQFPASEIYGLTNQIRRCAVSIPANIAEGYGRESTNEYAHFVSIALGSATELETLLLIAKNLKFLADEKYSIVIGNLQEVLRILYKLRQSLRARKKAA